jgi:hypothetical protein
LFFKTYISLWISGDVVPDPTRDPALSGEGRRVTGRVGVPGPARFGEGRSCVGEVWRSVGQKISKNSPVSLSGWVQLSFLLRGEGGRRIEKEKEEEKKKERESNNIIIC